MTPLPRHAEVKAAQPVNGLEHSWIGRMPLVNFIVIVSDTLRRDHLGCYANDWISTPNLDRLATESVLFDRAYSGSFPTIPHRTDLMTGRYSFTYSDWSPLPRTDVVLAQALGEAGYTSMFIADTPHLLRDGYYFDRGFNGALWVRGQENDRYRTDPVDVEIACDPEKLRNTVRTMTQYLRNTAERRYEEDYFAPQTMTQAMRWLEHNYRRDKFFLYVDTFDPHEPWDPPQWYVDRYDPGYQGQEIVYPIYGPTSYLTPEELKHIRALYAGEVTMVDRWVGALVHKVEDLGILDDTVILFTTDHGFYLGDHGLIGKVVMLYEAVNHIPLMFRMPGGCGRRSDALVQPADIMPTLLQLAGADDPGTMHGKSLVGLLHGDGRPVRDVAVSSWSIIHEPKIKGGLPTSDNPYEWAQAAWKLKPSTTTDGEWAYICGAGDMPAELYHLPTDPEQERNVATDHGDVIRELHARYIAFLESVGTNEEYLRHRRALP